jgi:hypothetical protein
MDSEQQLRLDVAELTTAVAKLAELTGSRDALIEYIEKFEATALERKGHVMTLLRVLKLAQKEVSGR